MTPHINMMKKKLEDMHLKERINYGYKKVIIMMLISGLFSIIVIGVLFANMYHYVENVSAADQAVKMCRVNVVIAALLLALSVISPKLIAFSTSLFNAGVHLLRISSVALSLLPLLIFSMIEY
jgi:magnesium-transporting ATPase (P-type)